MKKGKLLSFLLSFALLIGSFSGFCLKTQAGKTPDTVNLVKEKVTLEETEIVATSDMLETQWEIVNVLAGKNITASSVENAMPDNVPEKVLDGNNDTRWSSERMKNNGITDADAQTPQWLVVDLKAQTTTVTELSIQFYLKVWATRYKIETAETNTDDTRWEEVYSVERASSSDTNLVDNIELTSPLKRYVRFYFEKINVNAGGTGVSVREITMMGTQEGIIEDETIEADPNATYHRIFHSTDMEGMEILYGSGVSITGQSEGLLLNYTNTRAGVVDKQMGKYANGVFETTLVPKENGSRFGLIMRAAEEKKKILVGTENSNNLWFWEFWNGEEQKWSSTFTGPALIVGKEAKIKVELMGNQISLWVNETKVFTQTLPSAAPTAAGYFGFDKCNSAGSYLIKDIKYIEKESAATLLYGIESLPQLSVTDTQVILPAVKEGYRIEVVGSDAEGVITNEGKITDANIGEKEVNILVKITNVNDENDTARKSFKVKVPSKNSLREEIFYTVEKPNEKPMIIPSIQEWYGYEENFVLDRNTKIVVKDNMNLNLLAVAENMQADMKDITGFEPEIVTGEAGKNSIYIEALAEDVYDTGEEGYFMVTEKDGIKIYSHTYTGALYGTVTVEQILWRDDANKNVPCGVMRDYPDYEIRGVMFDVGRMPHRLQYLEDYTKILTWYKMSEFHLHLNDDFNYNSEVSLTNWNVWTGMHRLESDVFPSLTDRRVYQNNDYFNNEYADPVYTKEEYRQLEQLANSRGIDLIAEFDTPSHATAYIEYAQNNPDNIEWLGPINTTNTANQNGFPNNKQLLAININSADETEKQHALNARKFMEELYKDHLAGDNPTFISDTVHVGADEYWNSNEKEAFRGYINFLADLMASYGKTARMWGAQKKFAGNTPINPENIVLDIWATYEDDPIARLAEGYRVVNVPQPYLYTTPGRDHKDMIGEEYLYKNWNPLIFNGDEGVIAEAGEPLLLGAKAALWGDEFREGMTEADYHERMLRAVAITAEKTWGGQTKEDNYIDYQMAFEELKEGPGTEIAYDIKSKTEVVADYNLEKIKEDGEKIIVKDGSGNGYDAQVTGGKVVTIDDKNMIEFDGTTLMTTPLKTIGYPYTVSFEVKAKEGNSIDSLLFSGYDGQLRAADVNGNITIKRSFFTQDSGYTIPTDKSVTVTLVGNFQNTKLYVDGELVKEFASQEVNNERPSEGYWSTFVFPLEEIGKNFKGYIGNIKIYNKSFPQDTFVNYDTLEEINVALNKEAYAERFGNQPALNSGNLKRHPAWKTTDGDILDVHSYWLSSNNDNDYLMVDLEKTHQIHKVKVIWNGNQYARAFKVLVSQDGKNFEEVKEITGNTLTENVIEFETAEAARFVKIQGITRNESFYGIKELEVYEDAKLAREEITETKDGLWITGILEEYDFTNGAIRPEVKVYDKEKLLVEKKDYTLVYKNNKSAYALAEGQTGFEYNKAPQVMVKLKGNYSGTKTIYFKILPVDFSVAHEAGKVVVNTDKLSVNYKEKKQQMPLPTVYYEGRKLKYGKDFEIPEYITAKTNKSMFVTIGSHKITLKGKGNYTGTIKAEVIISETAAKIPMSKVTVKGIEKQTWKPEKVTLDGYTVTYNNAALTGEGTDVNPEYTVSYKQNDAVGTGYLILTGTGKDGNGDNCVFVGTKTIPFQITGTSMKSVTLEGIQKEYPYADGDAIVPTLYENEQSEKIVTVKGQSGLLEEGRHYAVSYQKNTDKGTATITFKGLETGGYTGTKKLTFKIIPQQLEKAKLELKGMAKDENGNYLVPIMKGGTKPDITLTTKNGKELVNGTDYTVSYKNNTKVDQIANITITGKGNYGGTRKLSFKIIGKELSVENGITVIAKDKTANGKQGGWKQSFKVYDANGKALSTREYDAARVEYILLKTMDEEGNWKPIYEKLTPEHTVPADSVIEIRVTGKGDYASKEGETSWVTGTYRMIEKGYDIGKATIKLQNQVYTGEKIEILTQEQFEDGKVYLKTPKGKETLLLGENIEVVPDSYVKNVNKGTAKVTFKGKEETRFGGTKTVSFKITSRETTNFWEIIWEFLGW